jgi:hypothetical protein
MRTAKLDWRKWIELIFGLLPNTLFFGSFLLYAMFALAVPSRGVGRPGIVALLTPSEGNLAIPLSIFGAAVGLAGLWAAFIFDLAQLRTHRRWKVLLISALGLGLAVDLYWITLVVVGPGPRNSFGVVVVALLLGAPLILASKYLYLLLEPGPE